MTGKVHIITSLQKFGEMCIATFKDNIHRAKLANRRTPGIWVGYADNHPTGTYRIFNPKTKRIILTRDVTFLNKSYGEFYKVEKPVILTTSYEGSDEEEEPKIIIIVILILLVIPTAIRAMPMSKTMKKTSLMKKMMTKS